MQAINFQRIEEEEVKSNWLTSKSIKVYISKKRYLNEKEKRQQKKYQEKENDSKFFIIHSRMKSNNYNGIDTKNFTRVQNKLLHKVLEISNNNYKKECKQIIQKLRCLSQQLRLQQIKLLNHKIQIVMILICFVLSIMLLNRKVQHSETFYQYASLSRFYSYTQCIQYQQYCLNQSFLSRMKLIQIFQMIKASIHQVIVPSQYLKTYYSSFYFQKACPYQQNYLFFYFNFNVSFFLLNQ
ncbi:unnamed protein product [Paramecium sonneborni]|uniref:Transmembrane protein n=1 Tax=Paramecium sonneborni TaxID=65129 RepID=A0A8S1RDV0_9CILI|nr:unnamed protein product [Paramecium sonneborni]